VEAPSASRIPDPGRGGTDGAAGKYRQATIELSLFDMEKDPLETTDVSGKFPEVAARLKGYAEQHKREFYS